MKNERILKWHEFCYLNGVRKANRSAIETYSDYVFGLRDLGIIAPNGQIEKKIIKLIIKIFYPFFLNIIHNILPAKQNH